MGNEEIIKLGRNVLMEHDLRFNIEHNGEVFVMKFPDPIVENQIETEIARRLGGYPRESFTENHLTKLRMIVTIDFLMVDSPTWFTSAGRCYDEQLIAKLFTEYVTFRESFQKKLYDGSFERDNRPTEA